MRGEVASRVIECAAQHRVSGARLDQVMAGVDIGVIAGVDVEVVGETSAGGGDVQHFAACYRCDQDVGGVDGPALGSVGGGGIAELDVVLHVRCGQYGLAVAVLGLNG